MKALTSVPQASLINLNFNPGVRFLGVDKDIMDQVLKDNPELAQKYVNAMYKAMQWLGSSSDDEIYAVELARNKAIESICQRLGFEPVEFNLSEFNKSGASLSCLITPLNFGH